MKKLFTLMALAIVCTVAKAQEDSTMTAKVDTIRVGNMVIIKDKSKPTSDHTYGPNFHVGKHNKKGNLSNVSTNWAVVDLGFSLYDDRTDYGNTGSYIYNRDGVAPLGEGDFRLRTEKSINVNIWFFIQRLNLIKHYVNLKYGLGLELNNYRFKTAVSFKETNPFVTPPVSLPIVFRDSVHFSKNKLAADYITVPFMLNFMTNPAYENKGLSLSVGVSAGYLYSERNKQVSDERGKRKNFGDYGMERFKFSYIGELGLGPVRLYGSYSPTSMFSDGLDMRPYTLGIRLSNW